MLPMTPANLKRAKADIKQCSIDHEPIRWAEAHMFLSHQYLVELSESSGPTRAADKGIEHIEEALKVLTEQECAPIFARAQYGLARLYRQRVSGNRTENLDKALACAKTGLRVCKRHPSCPLSTVADLYALIGSIYQNGDFGSSDSRAANDDLAIRHFLAALQRSSMYDDDSVEWANRQVKVGMIYNDRKNGDRHSNLKIAIKHWLEALKVLTKSKHRDEWAHAHNCLAMAYWQLISTADRAASLAKMPEEQFAEEQSALMEKCIASSTNALQVYSTTNDALTWAMMVDCLSNAYRVRVVGDRAENVETAIKHGMTALRGMDEFPLVGPNTIFSRIWRYKVRRTLADAYNVRVVGARGDNIEHVIDHLTKALDYVSMQTGPAAKTDIVLLRKAPLVGAARGWSDVMSGLGSAYGERVKGKRSENLRISMECLAAGDEVREWEEQPQCHYSANEAGEFFTELEFNGELELTSRETEPLVWAGNRIKAANKYLNLVDAAERKANMEKVIAHYLAAAEVLTKEEFPERWADIQMSLCDAYLQRVEGVRRENMENAMKCLNAYKEVHGDGDDALPADWLKQQWEKGAEARRRDAAAMPG